MQRNNTIGLTNIYRLIFNQDNDYYLLKDGKILEINSLCATRTFKKFSKFDDAKLVKPCKADYTIVRSENDRLLSAYNKKIVAKDDWKKIILRASLGVYGQISFIDFINRLIYLKKNSKFIDKHFRPCFASGEKVSLKNVAQHAKLAEQVKQTINQNVKSSKDVASRFAGFKATLSPFEISVVSRYLSLYDA